MVASGHRAVERCDHLGDGAFSDRHPGLYRPYLGKAHLAAVEQLKLWMHDAGMTTRVDAAGNLIGRYGALLEPAPSLLIGSHIDSVRDAGRYDGPLGIMLGIECVAALNETGRRFSFALEVIAFGDEEGSRFPASMLCSRAVGGQIDEGALNVTDRDGVSLDEALATAGLAPSEFLKAKRNASELVGYLEAHIEQGPVLEAEGLALGVVTAIAAQSRYEVVLTGIAGHAGTNSMALRRDALAASAEIMMAIERIAVQGPDDLVATVGRMTVKPGAPNVVPGQVDFSIDVRAGAEAERDLAARKILTAMDDIARARDIGLSHSLIHNLPASPCNASFMDLLSQAVEMTGQPARLIVSGAGHDAMVFTKLTPTAMLFVRCKGGVSHNPLESVLADDADQALKAMLAFIEKLEDTYA